MHSPRSTPSRAALVQRLARETHPEGNWLYSTNQIHTLVGGARREIVEQVRASRMVAPAIPGEVSP